MVPSGASEGARASAGAVTMLEQTASKPRSASVEGVCSSGLLLLGGQPLAVCRSLHSDWQTARSRFGEGTQGVNRARVR